jgi:Xaa-Pro dipeptidase
MGLGPQEHSSLVPSNRAVLTPGIVMTLEPDPRISEWGGHQHSDTMLITDDGFEFLTHTRRDLIQFKPKAFEGG